MPDVFFSPETADKVGSVLISFVFASFTFSVIPVPEAVDAGDRTVLTGEIPNPTAIPPGCRFHPRCPLYRELGEPARCRSDDPVLHLLPPREGDEVPHQVACHFADDEPPSGAQAVTS